MRSWTCDRGHVTTEVPYDYDLHAYEVWGADDHLVGKVIPDSVQASAECRAELEAGACPACEGWEDGMGNTIPCIAEGR